MTIGSVAAIRRYPIKSLRGEILDSVTVESDGIAGDRAAGVFARDGARAGKPYRGKEHDRFHLLTDESGAVEAAKARGTAVEIQRDEPHYFDDAPISILVDAWLAGVSDRLGYAVEWERFRPNFFVSASEGSVPLESALVDTELTLGAVRLRVRSPIERCVTVTYHPQGEPSDPRVLQFLATERNAWMGIYCDVLEPGTVGLGDQLRAG